MRKLLLAALLPMLTIYCSKSKDAPDKSGRKLSVQVLQDSLPLQGVSVTITLENGETRPEFMDKITDANGIVEFSGLEAKVYDVNPYKECSYHFGQFKIDMTAIQIGETKSFPISLFQNGRVKVINNTPYTQEIRHYNAVLDEERVNTGESVVFDYIYSSTEPEIDIQQYSGPHPHPITSYNLPATCKDTTILTLN